MSKSNKNTIFITSLDDKNEKNISAFRDVQKVEWNDTLLRLFITYKDGDTQLIFLDHFKDSLLSLQFGSDIKF
ncbi:TPA: hypothetical protein R1960_002177 [Staphylococcus delphini]|nr:hypothetical protein [Staphylococcus delphini]